MLASAGQLLAQECSHHEPSLEGLPITQITIEASNIFDNGLPDENLWIHRVANLLHITTREETIDGLLLVDTNQPYSERLVQETERVIREQDFIHDIEIETEQVCEEGVKLKVISTDNWTLTPSVSIGHSGGQTRTSVKIEESNLLGMGTNVKFKAESDEDRDVNTLSFKDIDWFGNRKQLEFQIGDNSDGFLFEVALSRPFYQLDSRDAWSIRAKSHQIELPVYEAGLLVDNVGQDSDEFQISYGWSQGLIDDTVERYGLGLFAGNTDTFNTPDFPTSVLPQSKLIRYPFFQYEFLQEEYIEMTNFRFMEVTEDVAVGDRLSLLLGWKDEAFGSSEQGHVLALDYTFGSLLAERMLAFYDVSLAHEGNSTIADTGSIRLGGKFYRYLDADHAYLFDFAVEAAQGNENFEQYALGGNTGLKGYPTRYQNGDRKVTLSMEKRDYFKWYPLRMFKIGTAFFAEAGSAWKSNEQPNFIGDVGLGLRFVSTRQSTARVLHVDLAFPVSEREKVDSYQFFLEARSQF